MVSFAGSAISSIIGGIFSGYANKESSHVSTFNRSVGPRETSILDTLSGAPQSPASWTSSRRFDNDSSSIGASYQEPEICGYFARAQPDFNSLGLTITHPSIIQQEHNQRSTMDHCVGSFDSERSMDRPMPGNYIRPELESTGPLAPKPRLHRTRQVKGQPSEWLLRKREEANEPYDECE